MRIICNTTPLWTGLVGTIGYTIYDGDTVTTERTTSGISETPAGSGIYVADVDVADIAGHMVVWDTDNDAPIYAAEYFSSTLEGYTAGATLARNILNLAARARVLYPKADILLYRELVQEAFLQMVHEIGGVYSQVATIDLLGGEAEYALPGDLREVKPHGVVLLLSDATVRELSSTSEAEVRADYITTPSRAGEPTAYYFPDDTHIGFDPMLATATNYTVRVRYDAEAPADLTMTEGLPIHAIHERMLIAYAIAEVARMANDEGRMIVEERTWKRGLAQKGQARERRMGEVPTRFAPYWVRQEREQ